MIIIIDEINRPHFGFIYPNYAPVIWNSGPYGAEDSGDIAGLKYRDFTSNESWQFRRCPGVLISRQNALHK